MLCCREELPFLSATYRPFFLRRDARITFPCVGRVRASVRTWSFPVPGDHSLSSHGM